MVERRNFVRNRDVAAAPVGVITPGFKIICQTFGKDMLRAIITQNSQFLEPKPVDKR